MNTIGKILIDNLIAEYGINAVEDYVNSQKPHCEWEDDWGNLYETEQEANKGVLNILYGEDEDIRLECGFYQLFKNASGDLLDWVWENYRYELIADFGDRVDNLLSEMASKNYHRLN